MLEFTAMRRRVLRGLVFVSTGRKRPADDKTDWWSRASVISSFLSSVVIAAVGLALTSSIQKAQIDSSKALGDAQIQIQKLKNLDDRRLQENKLASDLLQNLLSNEPRHRQFAIIMLRRTVDSAMYEELLSGIAASDPAGKVRETAIRQLSNSQDPKIATTLNKIAVDPARSPEERDLANKAKNNVAIVGSLSTGSCLFLASSVGTHAYETPTDGGIFTRSLLEGLAGGAAEDGKITLDRLGAFLQRQVPGLAMTAFGREQRPLISCEGYHVQDLPLFSRHTVALAIGITKYADPRVTPLRSSERDEAGIVAELRKHGDTEVLALTGEQATRSGILTAGAKLSAMCGPNSDCIVFFSGHGFSFGDKGYLMAYDSAFPSDTSVLADSSVSIQELMPILRRNAGEDSRIILFFDMDTSRVDGAR